MNELSMDREASVIFEEVCRLLGSVLDDVSVWVLARGHSIIEEVFHVKLCEVFVQFLTNFHYIVGLSNSRCMLSVLDAKRNRFLG